MVKCEEMGTDSYLYANMVDAMAVMFHHSASSTLQMESARSFPTLGDMVKITNNNDVYLVNL